jgi:hypothetical protein
VDTNGYTDAHRTEDSDEQKSTHIVCKSTEGRKFRPLARPVYARGEKIGGIRLRKFSYETKGLIFARHVTPVEAVKASTQQNDVAEILNKMTAADVIVMATPVCFHTVSEQMKTPIDRTHPRHLEMSNKGIYFIRLPLPPASRQWKILWMASEHLPAS